jgi:predicted ATPase
MIHSLKLTNFKNFRDATLRLGNLSLLVGTNASGKSNLRDAFRFLHGVSRGYTVAEIIGEKWIEGGSLQWKGIRGGTREATYYGRPTFTMQTSLSLGEGPSGPALADYLIEVDVGTNGKPARVARESLWRHRQMVFDSHPDDDPPAQEGSQVLYVRLPRDAKNRKHGKRLRFLANQPVLSQMADHAETPKGAKAWAERAIASLASMRFLDLAPDAMRLPSLPGQNVLGDRGENLSSVLQAICENGKKKENMLQWVRELTPLDVTDFEFVPDQTGKILVTLVEANGQRTSAYSASDGTLRFLAMYAAMRGTKPAQFYFFEELENGIHPTRLYLLLEVIEHEVSKGSVQVVATTHSPQLLGFLSEKSLGDAALIYRLTDHSDARIQRIIDIPDARNILEKKNLAGLHASGWLETVVGFLEGAEASA